MTKQPYPLICLEEVSKSFEMGEVTVRVLESITLHVNRGEFLAIVGPSGSGKTTLLNLIGGLDRPTVGRVLFDQVSIADLTARALTRFRREKVGFVFQLYNLVPNLTARENVAIAADLAKDSMEVDEALRLVGLDHRLDHFPSQLSGGEQQRVSIARAIVKQPALLLCDEPTGALDFETGRKVLRLLVDLNRRLGMTLVVITHNGALSSIADRTIQLRSGLVSQTSTNPNPADPLEVSW